MDTIFFHQFDTYSTFFFKDHSEIGYEPKVRNNHGYFEQQNHSSEEEVYVKNYGNPLACVKHEYIKLVIVKNENKVSFKIFECSRVRAVGKKYFIIQKNCDFITVDNNNGDVYQGLIANYQKKKKCRKTFRKNDFTHLNFLKFYNRMRLDSELIIEKQRIFHLAYRIFVNEINLNSDEPRNLSSLLLKNYLDKKKVKYPNNFKLFFDSSVLHKLKLKDIRKNNNKVVDAFMSLHNLKGEVIKKALHECGNLNVSILTRCLKMFGYDWMTQDYDMVLGVLNSKLSFYSFLNEEIYEFSFFSTKEKRKVFNFMKEYVVISDVVNIYTFFDHIDSFRELRELGETDIKWNAVNLSSFNSEHHELTSRLEYHKKGFYTRHYPSVVKDTLETPIQIEDETYFPVLLDNTEKYVEESATQSNCVKGYIGNPSSYIVSLRKKNDKSDTRATIEFHIYKDKDDKIKFRIRQSLTRFNQKLEDYWEKPIYILEERFDKLLEDKNFTPVMIEKIFQSGRRLSSDTYWDEMGVLRWSSVDITQYYE